MATTEHFVVSKADKKIRRMATNSREYWMKGGEKEGTIDCEIHVFSHGSNQQEEAKELYDVLKEAGLIDNYRSISISVK